MRALAKFQVLWPIFILFLAAPSCQLGKSLATSQSQLNSERIERRFGSYGIDVLEATPVRVSNLYSGQGASKICRTFAVVVFADNLPDSLQPAYSKIKSGASLGATLKAEGWKVEKESHYLGEIEGGWRFRNLARLKAASTPGVLAAVHVYDLKAVRAGQTVPFASIVEIHHPEYLSLQELKLLYPTIPSSRDLVGETESLLNVARKAMNRS